jgi:uncharacterized protein DUF6249
VEDFGSGAGLAALGFWLFIGIVVAAGVWDSIRKREAQHETLRRIIESGQHIDNELTDKLLALTGGNKDIDRDLRVGGVIMLFVAPGLAIFGWLMSLFVAEELLGIMLAVGALVLTIGIGLMVAAEMVRKWYREDKTLGLD